jgi:hypothetical protein
MNTMFNAFIKEKFMRGLNQYPGTIACIVFATARTAMFHVFQHRKGI